MLTMADARTRLFETMRSQEQRSSYSKHISRKTL
jgi:hypothetical protein